MDTLAVSLLGVAVLLVILILVYWMEHGRRMNVSAQAAERHQLVRALRFRQYDLRAAHASVGRLQSNVNEMQVALQEQAEENAELKEQVEALERESTALKARVTAAAQTLTDRDASIVLLKQQLARAPVTDKPAEKPATQTDLPVAPAKASIEPPEAPSREEPAGQRSAEALLALIEPRLTIARLEAQVAEQTGRAEMLAQRLAAAEVTLVARDELVHHLGEQLARVSGDTHQLAQQVLAAEKSITERDHSITALLSRLDRVFDLLEESRQQVVSSRRAVADSEVAEKQTADLHLTEESPAPVSESQQSPSENLTVINGIGPTIEKQLHEAGIHSVQDLADSSPEKIAGIVKSPQGRMREYGSWIEQAKHLLENSSHATEPKI